MTDKQKRVETKKEVCIKCSNETLKIAQDAQTDPSLHIVLRYRVEDMASIYEEFSNFHNQIIFLIDNDDDFAEQDKIRQNTDTDYYTIKSIYP